MLWQLCHNAKLPVNRRHLPLAQPDRGEAPHLTVDAAMLLVDRALQGAGSSQGCTREEVESAFAHLADPLVASAVWLDPQRTAIVILSPPTN
ncbi:MAG: hypothetical protein ACLPSH_00510 [Vulcanimicrobiaceae bacterium]|jgi:hypothetical protein